MKTETSPIKIGIIGLGRAGWGMHCQELRDQQKYFQISAGCDPIADRMEQLHQAFGSKSYERVEDLVRDEHVELVDIASRSSDHYAHAMLALEAGKDVLLEKPMTQHLYEAEQLVETAGRLGRKLFVRHNRRFDPDFLHVCEIVDSGLLGDVFLIKLNRHSFQRRNDWQTLRAFGGGQLLNWGPHIIDHALRLLQSPGHLKWSHLDQIQAAGDCEDHLKLIIAGENGRVADIEISGGLALSAPSYELHGTRGSLRLIGSTISLRYIKPGQELQPVEADAGTPGQSFGQTGTFQVAQELEWIEESLEVGPARQTDFWKELYRAIRHDEPFAITSEQALSVVRIVAEAKAQTRFN